MNKIIPHIWFDKEALEAAQRYVSVFENAKINHTTKLEDTPSGTAHLVELTLAGQPFQFISAGPFFTPNPTISFLINCSTKEEVDKFYNAFIEGGFELMPLGTYPFSPYYAWVEDKYHVSWQIMLNSAPRSNQKIIPTLMYVGKHLGECEEAVHHYIKTFGGSQNGEVTRYSGEAPNPDNTVRHVNFTINGLMFGAMDSGYDHNYQFNEGVSFIIPCETQEEIDRYWSLLSHDPEAEQCGWCKDQFGVSWQITPSIMGELLNTDNQEKKTKVIQTFLGMKKFDINQLKKAAE